MGSIDLEDETLMQYDYSGYDEDETDILDSLPPLSPVSQSGDIETALNDAAGLGQKDNILDSSTTDADGKKIRRTVTRKPQPKIDEHRLTDERGIPTLKRHFEKINFKGEGHEVEDLNLLMSTFEHWTHRLFPRLTFDDMIQRIEKLGRKKLVQVCVKKIRLDMPLNDEDFQQEIKDEDFADLVNSTDDLVTPTDDLVIPTDDLSHELIDLTETQKERMERNKKQALERLQAKKIAEKNEITDNNDAGDLCMEEIEEVQRESITP